MCETSFMGTVRVGIWILGSGKVHQFNDLILIDFV